MRGGQVENARRTGDLASLYQTPGRAMFGDLRAG
jgi:hypothetical protein